MITAHFDVLTIEIYRSELALRKPNDQACVEHLESLALVYGLEKL
jgi:hypothetical protein